MTANCLRSPRQRPRRRWWLTLPGTFAILLVAAACSDGGGGDVAPSADQSAAAPAAVEEQASVTTEARAQAVGAAADAAPDSDPAADHADDPGGRGVFAGIDTSIRSVGLEDIRFDLFNGSSVSLARIDEARLRSLIDAITPLDAARDLLPDEAQLRVGTVRYVPADEATFLSFDMVVLGYVADDGQAYAYSLGILQFHELVNDTLGGRAVLISYCPLCRSGVVYDRVVGGEVLTFGNTSALYQNDLVMFDRQTNSYWFQTGGEAVVGTLTGARLTPLVSAMMPFSSWLRDHPDTLVLSTETGVARNYTADFFASGYTDAVEQGQLPFPVDAEILADARLSSAEVVLGLEIDGQARAYPLDQLGGAAFSDDLAGHAVVIFSAAAGPAGVAYEATLDGTLLSFDAIDTTFVDRETGSRWTLSGRAIEGPLEGAQLTPLPSRTAFWFSYLSAFPDATVAEIDRVEARE